MKTEDGKDLIVGKTYYYKAGTEIRSFVLGEAEPFLIWNKWWDYDRCDPTPNNKRNLPFIRFDSDLDPLKVYSSPDDLKTEALKELEEIFIKQRMEIEKL